MPRIKPLINRPPAFQHYVKDWLTSKKRALMDLDQQAAYFNLLNHLWDTDDCSLPDDPVALAILSEFREKWNDRSTPVRACFDPHPKVTDRITNLRLYYEHRKLLQFRAAAKIAGIASGVSRRKHSAKPDERTLNERSTKNEPTLYSSSSSSSSSSIKDKEVYIPCLETTPNKVAYREDAKTVLRFLNEKTGKSFREVEANLSLIEARLKSGVDIQACKTLIARKVRDWKTDEAMAKYLRPSTLFNKTKFESYLGEVT